MRWAPELIDTSLTLRDLGCAHSLTIATPLSGRSPPFTRAAGGGHPYPSKLSLELHTECVSQRGAMLLWRDRVVGAPELWRHDVIQQPMRQPHAQNTAALPSRDVSRDVSHLTIVRESIAKEAAARSNATSRLIGMQAMRVCAADEERAALQDAASRRAPTNLPYSRHVADTRPGHYVSAQHAHLPRPASHRDVSQPLAHRCVDAGLSRRTRNWHVETLVDGVAEERGFLPGAYAAQTAHGAPGDRHGHGDLAVMGGRIGGSPSAVAEPEYFVSSD